MLKISKIFSLFLPFFCCLTVRAPLERVERGEQQLFQNIIEEKDAEKKISLILNYLKNYDAYYSHQVINQLFIRQGCTDSIFIQKCFGKGEDSAYHIKSISSHFTEKNRQISSDLLMKISCEPLRYQEIYFNCPGEVAQLKKNNSIILPFQLSKKQITDLQQIQSKIGLQSILLLFFVRYLEFKTLNAAFKADTYKSQDLVSGINILMQEYQNIANQEKLAYEKIINELENGRFVHKNKYETNIWGTESVKLLILNMILNLERVVSDIFFEKNYQWVEMYPHDGARGEY